MPNLSIGLRRVTTTLLATTLLAGCGLPIQAPALPQGISQANGTVNPAGPAGESGHLDASGWSQILTSIQKNSVIPQYSIKATLNTRGLKQTHTTAIYGNIGAPYSISMSERLDGQSYYFYQNASVTYFREQNVWREIGRVQIPNPWQNLSQLTSAPPQTVYRLPDTIIISFPAEVYQFQANGSLLAGIGAGNWSAGATAPAGAASDMPSLYTFMIDKKSGLLKRIIIETTSSIEDVGTVTSTNTIDFFNLDGKSVDLTEPQGLLDQLKKKK